MVRVAKVTAGGIAEELGISPGTDLRSINGRALDDFLDWEFLSAEEKLEIEVTLPGGEDVIFEVERPGLEPFGLELEPPTVRRCANRCEFCFVEGLPKGLRRSLYIRDDDYRLSFAYGNFATLSNLKERDVARILEYRLSPLYVSVHATPWEARKKLLNNPRVPDVLAQLETLSRGGIQFHCQMVIVPGLNDGDVLEQSLEDLWSLNDSVLTVAVVPVGLTQFSHLYKGDTMSPVMAAEILSVCERWGERGRGERAHTWATGSDELYLLAGCPLPDPLFYGDYPQIENGVGAVTALRQRVKEGLSQLPRLDGKRIGVVTGVSMGPLMPPLLDLLAGATGATFDLICAKNSLFGAGTTTAGLLVGNDIRRALDARSDLDFALIPAEAINDDGLFLDDEPLSQVRSVCSMPLHASYDFIDVLGASDVISAPGRREAAIR